VKRKRFKEPDDIECDCPVCRGEIDMSIPLDGMIEDFLIQTRRIVLVGEVNEISSTHVCNYLQMYSLTNEPIYIYINSPGGDVPAGYAIIDQIKASQCPIYTIVRGQAHSMGAMITAFGSKGHRYAMPNASFMLHSLVIHTPPDPIDHHASMMDYLKEDCHRKIVDLARRLKINAEQLEKLMNNTRWMSSKQALKIGLIDRIWTPHMEQMINKKFKK